MTLTALIVVFVLFGIYGWLSSIEFGIALLRLSKRSGAHTVEFFTPIWEVTNVFLVFGFTGFAILFNNSLVLLSRSVLPILALGITALLVRATLVLYIFYGHQKPGIRWPNMLFVVASFIVPLSFGVSGIYLLSGHNFWQSQVGWALCSSLVTGFVAVGASFSYWHLSRNKLPHFRLISRLSSFLFYVVSVIWLQMAVRHYLPHIVSAPYKVAITIFILASLSQLLLWLKNVEYYQWWFLSLLALVSPSLFMLANRPYLVYPTTLIVDAYGARAYDKALFLGFMLVFPLLLIGLGLLLWLLISKKQPRA